MAARPLERRETGLTGYFTRVVALGKEGFGCLAAIAIPGPRTSRDWLFKV